MEHTGNGWAVLLSGKIASRRDCERVINNNDALSPESDVEMDRRTA